MQFIYIDLLGPNKVKLIDKKEGGFAEVLILADGHGDPKHAFKVLKPNIKNLESVVTEVHSLSQLPTHPNVVEVAGYCESDVGAGILLRYYPSSLRAFMQEGARLRDKLVVAKQILHGLQQIHANGILHLDLKPDNVLISKEGTAAISDFGISKLFEKADLVKNPELNVSLPKISGTLLYMAPEQLVQSDVSVKTDVFAFGVLLYELVVGSLPWTAETVSDYAKCILYSRERFGLKERMSIPSWLRQLISACLAKAPENRPTVDSLLRGFASEGFSDPIAMHDEDIVVREVNRASLLAQAGNKEQAAEILVSALKTNPWNLTARINLAEISFAMGNVDDAIASARITLLLAPWNETKAKSEQALYLNLGLYLMTKSPREAYTVTSRSLEQFPDNWELMHNHAEACLLTSIDFADHREDSSTRVQEGLVFAEKALQSQPDDVPLRVTYAGLLRLSGQRDRFIPYINQLLNDAGSYSVATRLLFIDALIDEGELASAERQISELSKLDIFNGLLDGQRQRLARRRADSN
jgi:serine/threonine protein kinase